MGYDDNGYDKYGDTDGYKPIKQTTYKIETDDHTYKTTGQLTKDGYCGDRFTVDCGSGSIK